MDLLLLANLDVPNFPSELELCLRILLAAGLAALVGLEREVTDHPSGMRTHILVGVGSCLFGVCSAYAFTEFAMPRMDSNYQIDVTRVASQVVVGVGFLGGGAIIKHGSSIRGLTSAAGLWVSSAIGLSVALGMYWQSITATFSLLAALVLLRAPRRWIRRYLLRTRENVVVQIPLNADPGPVITAIEQLEDCEVESLLVKRRPDDEVLVIEADMRIKGGRVPERISSLEAFPGVLSVDIS